MLPPILRLFSIILTSGYRIYEDNEVDTDTTCLLQSYIVPHTRQVSSKLTKNRHVAGISFTSSVAIGRKSPSGLSETTQVMLGAVLVVVVGFVIAVVFALQFSQGKNGTPLQRDDFTGSPPRSTQDLSVMKLNPALVVPRGSSMSYFLPDINLQHGKSLESFKVLDKNGTLVLGVLVKDGIDDPGILLHAAPSGGGPGAPMVFISTQHEALQNGGLRIAWPSADHPRGEMFGTLEPDGNNAFKVLREGRLLLWIGGRSKNFMLSTESQGSGESIGTTAPARDNGVELRLQSGSDAALAVLCILAIMKLSASTERS